MKRTYLEDLQFRINNLLECMADNKANGLDNSAVYEKYEELTAEQDMYYGGY